MFENWEDLFIIFIVRALGIFLLLSLIGAIFPSVGESLLSFANADFWDHPLSPFVVIAIVFGSVALTNNTQQFVEQRREEEQRRQKKRK